MVTDKQWEQFCWDVYFTKRQMHTIYLKGRRVDDIDLTNYQITTIKQGFGPTVYRKNDSCDEYTSLKRLYDSVTFECDMTKIFKLRRMIKDD